MHILFITCNYPSKSLPIRGVFVQELVRTIARSGIKCSVINPVTIFDLRYGRVDPRVSFDYSINDNYIKVVRPRSVSFSNKRLFNYNTFHLTQKSYEWAVQRALSDLDFFPSILCGHFLYPSGATAVRIGSMLGVPSVVAVGDSSLSGAESMGWRRAIQDFTTVSGVIAVSSVIKQSLIDHLKISEEKIAVFPNGVDLSRFFPRERFAMRKKYGFPNDKFIIVFVGHFDERKGPHRLLSAVSGMDNIGLVFIGAGKIPLIGKNILFKGALEHEKVPEMLSAADIFVLPTLAEGSCNAIIEAMACGLPLVTSINEFNDDIIDGNVAIRIDPKDVNEIRDAIVELSNNRNLRNKMSSCALEKAKQFDISLRAEKIMQWLEELKKLSL